MFNGINVANLHTIVHDNESATSKGVQMFLGQPGDRFVALYVYHNVINSFYLQVCSSYTTASNK